MLYYWLVCLKLLENYSQTLLNQIQRIIYLFILLLRISILFSYYLFEDGPPGCLLEVDLDYPDELHEFHNDYTLTAEKIKVTNKILSQYQSRT